MKIYLVAGDEYENRYIVSRAFATRQAAEEYIAKMNLTAPEPGYYHLAEEVELEGFTYFGTMVKAER